MCSVKSCQNKKSCIYLHFEDVNLLLKVLDVHAVKTQNM